MTCLRRLCILSCLLGLSVTSGCAGDPLRFELLDRPQNKASQALVEIQLHAGVTLPIASLLISPQAYHSFSDSRFVTKWLLLGPFRFKETDFDGEQQSAAIDHPFMPDEAALDGKQLPPENARARWKPSRFRGGHIVGMVDLDAYFNTPEHAAAYAVTWIDCPRDMEVRMLVGSDDYIKVWINGQHVHTYGDKRRNARPDQDEVTVTLRKGLNRVVVKSVDVVYDWCFFLRFALPRTRDTVVGLE